MLHQSFGPLSSVPLHTVGPQQLDDVTLQPVYVNWMRFDKNFWVIHTLPSTAFSPQAFITLSGLWIPAHLRNLFREAAGNPLQPTSNGTRVQPYPLSRTSATSSSYRSNFLSCAFSIPSSHATVSSPSNRSGRRPDAMTSTWQCSINQHSPLPSALCQSQLAS
ncbi:unnamed protein product [Acanthosepion pharaonis]|uniref:Uncharacterized protein n=1 Tax=Acanthosepion pharaonis TaxID=158019 RepID=A0A812B2W5_ACAPH|nr:unnamed protein product [Sepia pharaonis]